ncbi:hypothetical protein NDR96_08985 [Stenotrophomonas maltophilia]|nr:hypothetical protein NDR96_08985 [Stenotrophomonas maltophilia]CAH0064566.1 conserved protein of unknown function [Stenotrophomonas maltophilia]
MNRPAATSVYSGISKRGNAMIHGRSKHVVDVERELAHWKIAFNLGALPAMSFRYEVAPVIRLACDIYVRDPHGTRSAWIDDLQGRLAKRSSLRGHPGAAEIADRCWSLLGCA